MKKAGYVDGFVLIVPKKNFAAYRRMATMAGKLWRKHGALDYKECVADDMKTPCGMPFPKLVKLRKGEAVWYSFITYKSRAHRDAVNKRVMKDPVMNDPKWATMKMPFDMKRMTSGGFKIVVHR